MRITDPHLVEDGHYFCSLPTPPPSPQDASPMSPSPSTSSLPPLNSIPKRKKKRRRQPRGCRAEFDYTGWEQYNQWRREYSRLKSESQSLHNPHFIAPLKIGKDCYRDCDFPSECQTTHFRTPITPVNTRRKSEPELIYPISPVSIEECQRIEDEREDQQLIFDIAATTPPATRSPNLTSTSSSPDLGVLVERERRKSLEAEKRGLEHEAQFIVSPLTSHTAFADLSPGGSMDTTTRSLKGKEREGDGPAESPTKTDGLGVSYPEVDDFADAEETEEDEKGYVREFIRVKKRKSIAKIEQLTGLRLSEVQYGKMEGEVVEGQTGGAGAGNGDGSTSRRASVEIESPPSSPLKAFYTVEDSDDEDDLDEVTPWEGQRMPNSWNIHLEALAKT